MNDCCSNSRNRCSCNNNMSDCNQNCNNVSNNNSCNNGNGIMPVREVKSAYEAKPACGMMPAREKMMCKPEPRREVQSNYGNMPGCNTRPANEMKPACEMRPACGMKPACEMRSACGMKPACGMEPANEMKPACGMKPACEMNTGNSMVSPGYDYDYEDCSPDNYGCDCVEYMPIAMAYVPWQQWGDVFDGFQGLEAGTIFPELEKPFYGSCCK